MKWILVAIVAVIVPYTFLTLRYRKEGPAFQPYEDMKNRANVSRLLAAGYQRMPIVAQRPADRTRVVNDAAMANAAGGLPADLRSTLVEALVLPVEYTAVAASGINSTLLPYVVELTCLLPDERQQLAGADLYVRGDQVVIAPTFEPVGGGLSARSPQATVLLTIAPGTLKPGRYTVTLAGERGSRVWPLQVN